MVNHEIENSQTAIIQQQIIEVAQRLNQLSPSPEGVFRISVEKTKLDRFVEDLISGQKVEHLSHQLYPTSNDDEVHLLANALKRLMKQPGIQPLITETVREKMIDAYERGNQDDFLSAFNELPERNKLLLSEVFQVCDHVISLKDDNKMGPEALATCISPVLFKQPELSEIATASKINNQLLTNLLSKKNRAQLLEQVRIDDSQDILNAIDREVQTVLSKIDFMRELQQEIAQHAVWQVGLFGGKQIQTDKGIKITVPHTAAKMWDICQNTTVNNVDDNLVKICDLIENRDNPKGFVENIKALLKKFDFLNIFSRRESTETFYKDKLTVIREKQENSHGLSEETTDKLHKPH